VLDRLPVFHSLVEALREVLVVVVFEAENEVAIAGFKIPDMGGVRTESILGDDDFQMRMVFSKLVQPALAGISLRVVFGVWVRCLD